MRREVGQRAEAGGGQHVLHLPDGQRRALPPRTRRGDALEGAVFFFSLSSLEWSETQVYAPQTRAFFGTASQFCEVIVLKLGTVPNDTTVN